MDFDAFIDDPSRWTGDSLQMAMTEADEAAATRRKRLCVQQRCWSGVD
jgi:hypothetical protein